MAGRMDDYDISGLDPQSAREYVQAVLSTLKQTTAARVQLEKELALWASREQLAKEKEAVQLIEHAAAKVAAIRQDLERIRSEERPMLAGTVRLKSQLKLIEGQAQLPDGPEMLLGALEMLTGERDELADRFREEEAADAVRELKEKMDGEEGSD